MSFSNITNSYNKSLSHLNLSPIPFLILFSIFSLIILYSEDSIAYTPRSKFSETEIESVPDIFELKLRVYWGEKNDKMASKVSKYIELYGFGYNTLHHIGFGIMYYNRSFKGDFGGQKKEWWLNRAIDDFSFCLDPERIKKYNSNFKSTFLPSIYFLRGRAYFYSNRFLEAIKDFSFSIKIKPSYCEAYVMMLKCYEKLGMSDYAGKMKHMIKSKCK